MNFVQCKISRVKFLFACGRFCKSAVPGEVSFKGHVLEVRARITCGNVVVLSKVRHSKHKSDVKMFDLLYMVRPRIFRFSVLVNLTAGHTTLTGGVTFTTPTGDARFTTPTGKVGPPHQLASTN